MLINDIIAQEFQSSGAMSEGMGNTQSFADTAFAGINNPSLNAFSNISTISIHLKKPFLHSDISQLDCLFQNNAKTFHWSGYFRYFGNSDISIIQPGMSAGIRLNSMSSIGLNAGLERYQINTYPSFVKLNFGLSILINVSNNIACSMIINNPIRSTMTQLPDGYLPSSFCFGLSYSVSKSSLMTFENSWSGYTGLSSKLAIRYAPFKQLSFCGGINFGSKTIAMSMHYSKNNYRFDFSHKYNQVLGFGQSLSIRCKI